MRGEIVRLVLSLREQVIGQSGYDQILVKASVVAQDSAVRLRQKRPLQRELEGNERRISGAENSLKMCEELRSRRGLIRSWRGRCLRKKSAKKWSRPVYK